MDIFSSSTLHKRYPTYHPLLYPISSPTMTYLSPPYYDLLITPRRGPRPTPTTAGLVNNFIQLLYETAFCRRSSTETGSSDPYTTSTTVSASSSTAALITPTTPIVQSLPAMAATEVPSDI